MERRLAGFIKMCIRDRSSYSEYLNDLSGWYSDYVSPKFVDYRNRLMALLNQESSLMEIVKLIGGDVLPDDQKPVSYTHLAYKLPAYGVAIFEF